MFTPLPKDDATTAARARLAQALQRQDDLSRASANRPELEVDYQRAVADVVRAQSELDTALKGATKP